MNVKLALKKKSFLIQEIETYLTRLRLFNSVDVANVNKRDYAPREALQNWLAQTDALISLKAQIQRTNIVVYEKIVRLAELKGMVKNLKTLDCTEGTSRRYSDTSTTYTSEISMKERDELVKKLELEISSLQDELDEFNHQTALAD